MAKAKSTRQWACWKADRGTYFVPASDTTKAAVANQCGESEELVEVIIQPVKKGKAKHAK